MNSKSKSIAMGGLMTALSVILLYLGSILPTGTLILLTVASLPVAIMIIENGYGYGLLTYGSTGIAFFIFSGNIKGLITYSIFFGIYPVIKLVAEKNPFIIKEFALKIGFFNLSLMGILYGFKLIGIDFLTLVKGINFPFGYSDAKDGILYWAMPYILFAVAQIAFLVYDYAFSILIGYYIKRFQKKLSI